MRKTNEGASPVRLILLAAFAGLAATLVLMLISAALVHRGTLGEAMIPTISLACLALGCMLASFLAARRLPDGRLALALAGGAVAACPFRSHSRQSALCSRGFGARHCCRHLYAHKK